MYKHIHQKICIRTVVATLGSNSISLETTHMSISRKTIKQIVLYSHNGMVDNKEEEGTTMIILSDMDESHKYNVDEKNPNITGYMW